MKLYISGKITGCTDYQHKFGMAAAILKDKGHVVINPAMLPQGLDNDKYMPICMPMIDACDAIVMIGEDWKDSKGAILELNYAKYNGKVVYLNAYDVPKALNV